MDYKVIIIGLFLMGLGGGVFWSVINSYDEFSIGDSVQKTTVRKYDRSIVSQRVREYGVWDVISREIFPTVFGICLLLVGGILIKDEFY